MAKKRPRMKLVLGAKWHEDAESANVLGEIPGGEDAAKIVLLGAHLDSWDVGQGAIDDGAGCAIVLEAARLVAALGRKPRRTIRVALFAAEELGLAGGQAYAKSADSESHVAAIEADMGTAKVYAARFLGPAERRGDFEAIAKLLAPLGIETEAGDAYGGADMGGLRRLGVPALELTQDFSAYFDVHHTENDTIERVDAESLKQAAAAYATVAWAIAEHPSDLGRVPQEKRERR